MNLYKVLTALLLLVVHGTQASEVTPASWSIETNSLALTTNHSYKVTGSDPFVVFTAQLTESSPRYIQVELDTRNAPPNGSVAMELFYRSGQTKSAHVFDPLYRLQFELPTSQRHFAIPLPKDVFISDQTYFRLDIDRCNACEFKFLNQPELIATPKSTTHVVVPSRVYNGANNIEGALSVPTQGWHSHDLLSDDNGRWQLNGKDPFIVSPLIDADTQQLGGVRFALNVVELEAAQLDFQLFYATERHGFIESASTLIRVPTSSAPEITFAIPLAFLGTEFPKARLLERLRLDFDGALSDASWQLLSVDVLDQTQMAEHQSLVPERMLQNKQQRARGVGLVIKSLKKVVSDPGFTVGYLLLLIITTLGFWRAYRK